MIAQKVQLTREDLEFIQKVFRLLEYKSKSDYMRQAIREKIRSDRRRREMKRQEAMKAYGQAPLENAFQSIEAEGFEER